MEAVKNEKFQAQLNPVLIQKVRQLAEADRRTVSQMAGILLEEAIKARAEKQTN